MSMSSGAAQAPNAFPLRRQPIVLADVLPGALARDAVLVVAGAAFVGLCAQLSIPLPFTPVPITGQTFAVLLGGAALGWRRGAAAMLLYAVAGLAGVPWFAAHHGGSASLYSASFGYILGYPFAAALTGRLAKSGGDRTPPRATVTMLAGSLVIYAFGLPWLMANQHIGLLRGLDLGVFPFLVGDVLKALAAAAVLPAAWALAGRVRR